MEENKKNKDVSSAAALTLGIISICFAIFWHISLPTGILAIIFGVKSAKKTGSKVGKAGMITGIVGLSLFLLIYVSFIFLIILSNI